MKPKVIAHRGFSGKYPENTMLAFEKAISEGRCDGIETDVHLSADGQVVIIHDSLLDRTTNGSGPVGEHTWDQLRRLDAGAKYAPQYAGEGIPLLSQLLDLAGERGVSVNVELKYAGQEYPGLEEKVVRLVKEREMTGRVFFSSFSHNAMARCSRLCPEMTTGLLYGHPLYKAEEYCRTTGAGALHPHYSLLLLEPDLRNRCREAGVLVNVWTVNEEEDMRRMLDLEVDGIITNHPDVLRKLLEQPA